MSAAPAALILTRRDIAALMRPADWLRAVEDGFAAAADGHAQSPPPMAICGTGGTFHAKGARIHLERDYVALKLNANFPGNPERIGLPTIQGAILLCDGTTGALLAVMDSIEVTLRRTAAATALAARFLARAQSHSVLICGCGEQGAAQLAALREVLPLARGSAWDRDQAKAAAFARNTTAEGFPIELATDLPKAAWKSDVIVTCTTARTPFLDTDTVRPGAFIAAVGADSPDKSEIAPALMANALVVVDVVDQCVAMGDLHHAIAAGAMPLGDVHAELAELVAGHRPGRTSDEQITLFDSTGTALQDVAAAALIYRRALEHGSGLAIVLGEV
ncbi:ornithine cyclodeaminase family protein [Sphingomonas sp.]|uniref:ornithine cyclodeaminase family protein n=1 Tax=Sphingomonas sp. TaxID=28214 RepID=UPI00286E689A|nr:ornithine cyclodeaminase family protein [Sphingomonas sp.]